MVARANRPSTASDESLGGSISSLAPLKFLPEISPDIAIMDSVTGAAT